MLRKPIEDVDHLTITDLHRPIVFFQLPVYMQQTLILKLEMPNTGIGVRNYRRLKTIDNEIGDSGLFSQHERFVILRAQVALHPYQVDGVLSGSHARRIKGMEG